MELGPMLWVLKPWMFPVVCTGNFSCEVTEIACMCNPETSCQRLVCIISSVSFLLSQLAHLPPGLPVGVGFVTSFLMNYKMW